MQWLSSYRGVCTNKANQNVGRKRKKKCDEVRPSCSTCTARCIECIWPQGKEKLPKEYKIPPANPKLRKERKVPFEVIPYNAPKPSKHTEPEPQWSETPLSDLPLLLSTVKSPSPEEYESLDTETCMVVSRNGPDQIINNVIQTPPLTLRPSQRQLFIDVCVNGFIKSLGPQYTHPLLTTSATFTPLISRNKVIENVAEACGCAFLSWSNPDLTELSFKKYRTAVTVLMKYVDSKPIVKEDEIWLGAAFQMLCLGAKITWNCDNKICVTNLKNSYKLIKAKLQRRQRKLQQERLQGPKLPNDGVFQDITSDSLKLEVRNTLIGYETARKSALFEKQFERMFVESFIYNFSVTILTTDDIMGLPNVFEVFDTLKSYVKTPLFSCDVVWMNNPVLGAAFDAFELAAKASYLLRTERTPWSVACAMRLLEVTKVHKLPVIPPEIRFDEQKYANLNDSVNIADIVIRTAKIVLRKVLDPALSEYDPEVQKDVDHVLSCLLHIPAHSPIWVISTWPMFITGLSTIDLNQRECIMNVLFNAAELIHGRCISSIIDLLHLSWGLGTRTSLNSPLTGLDVLLDPQLLSTVFL